MFENILEFTIGPINSALWTVVGAMVFNAVGRLLSKEHPLIVLDNLAKRIFAYMVFIIIGNRIDAMGIDDLFGWAGSTQYLVILGLAAKEIMEILTTIQERWNIQVPFILNKRLDQVQRGDTMPDSNYIDSDALERRIESLKRNMEKLKELNKLEKEAQELGADEFKNTTPTI